MLILSLDIHGVLEVHYVLNFSSSDLQVILRFIVPLGLLLLELTLMIPIAKAPFRFQNQMLKVSDIHKSLVLSQTSSIGLTVILICFMPSHNNLTSCSWCLLSLIKALIDENLIDLIVFQRYTDILFFLTCFRSKSRA